MDNTAPNQLYAPVPMQNPQFDQQQMQTVSFPSYNPQPLYLEGNPMLEQHIPGRQPVEVIGPNPNKMQTAPQGRKPEKFYCDSCKKEQLSQVSYPCGRGSWACALISLVACPCFVCAPCCCREFRDAAHVCPECRKEVGRNEFMSQVKNSIWVFRRRRYYSKKSSI